ncbi:PR-1-like protein [Aulographum hederae CBS 113979]|uniref:PR-1-like protein n=1 Tax=Aulographum hederae CBS 113979 TaxID=1176131 RepID=A0A6G1GNK8_9PEZI|nr:PR-1-like protein [Aulographum hederae CBS 113979]
MTTPFPPSVARLAICALLSVLFAFSSLSSAQSTIIVGVTITAGLTLTEPQQSTPPASTVTVTQDDRTETLTQVISISTIVVSLEGTTTVTQGVASPTPSSDSSWTNDDEFKRDVLNSTNFFRREHNAAALDWNDTLAERAADGKGENLAEGFLTVEDAIDDWAKERKHFSFKHPDWNWKSGEFSQLVWKSTRTVGCARKFCGDWWDWGNSNDDDDDYEPYSKRFQRRNGVEPEGLANRRRTFGPFDDGSSASGWFMACEYWPPGNVDGEFPENVQGQITDDGGDSTSGVIGEDGSGADGQIGAASLEKTSSVLLAIGAFVATSLVTVSWV